MTLDRTDWNVAAVWRSPGLEEEGPRNKATGVQRREPSEQQAVSPVSVTLRAYAVVWEWDSSVEWAAASGDRLPEWEKERAFRTVLGGMAVPSLTGAMYLGKVHPLSTTSAPQGKGRQAP